MQTYREVPMCIDSYPDIIESSSEDDDTSIPTESSTSTEDLYSNSILFYRRPLNKYDRKIGTLNERAMRALKEDNKELFVKIILKTKSLYVRDNAARLAAETGWIDVAERILIRKSTTSYQHPVWPAPLSMAFLQFDNTCDVKIRQGRWLLQTAILSAIKKDKEEAFKLFVPIVGIDFLDANGMDVIDNVSSSQTNLGTQKKWLDLIIKYVDRNTSCVFLESAIRNYARLRLVEHLPYLLDCLFSINKGTSLQVMETLAMAIKNHRSKVVHCIIDEFKEASIPIHKTAMYAAESIGDIDMVLHLYCNGCHSFPLLLYGEESALRLRNFLSKYGHEDLYTSIIME